MLKRARGGGAGGRQVLRGSALAAFAMTSSPAHMDIPVPDYFFRYWPQAPRPPLEPLMVALTRHLSRRTLKPWVPTSLDT